MEKEINFDILVGLPGSGKTYYASLKKREEGDSCCCIDCDYLKENNIELDCIFNDDMFKPIDLNIFVQNCDNLGNICAYSDEEYEEIKALWEELDI